ncbi:MAG: hypothetical protein RLZZ21_289 [Planctomycetota bacterium]|jgi:hypothetical protein
MIAAAPVAAAANVSGVLDKIHAFIATSKSAAADGLTWAEFGELLVALLRLVVAAIDTVTLLTGAEKKALTLEAVASLFDAVADRAVPAAVYPLWLLVRSPVRSLVIAIASGAIEQLLPLVRKAG